MGKAQARVNFMPEQLVLKGTKIKFKKSAVSLAIPRRKKWRLTPPHEALISDALLGIGAL
jgi:hypothetical protein